ncbi:hypothetical protein ACQKKX_07715 [Neorhizobium sp. NPDC001467]|uniref:hypothetical protein n=1 Tax=Neorhizobium sp. NPDC001467 TaxID=3390595 RepID=UPI003D08F404
MNEISCADLSTETGPLGPPGLFFYVQPYLSMAVSSIWQLSSVKYANLWPIVALLSGLYAAGCFTLTRQFLSRFSATVGAAFLTASPVALPLIVSFRDYAKAPFFVWTLVFLIAALRTSRFSTMTAWVVASGLAIGLGCGFRADLIILLPIGMLALLIAFEWRLFLSRLAAAFVLAVVVIVSAYPVLSHGKGGTHGSLIVQGMSDPFRAYLKMTPAPYSFGSQYSDELVLSAVAADARSDHPQWDAGEGQPVYGLSQANTLSGAHWQRFFPFFLSDFVNQAFKSAALIVGFPLLAAPGSLPDPGYPVMAGPSSSTFMAPLYVLFAKPWMPWLGMLGVIVFLARLWARSRQEAVALAFTLTALSTYPVVQFSIRHVFHLEFIWVLSMLSLAELPWRWRAFVRAGWSYGATLAGAAAMVIAVVLLLGQYQQAVLAREFAALLALPRDRIDDAGVVQGRASLTVPVPSEYQDLIGSQPDSMTPNIAGVGLQWEVRSAADRLLLTISGAQCSGQATIMAHYAKTDNVWQAFDQRMTIAVNGAGEGTRLLLPAFYRPTQHLSSVDVADVSDQCSLRLERIDGRTIFPSLLTAIFPPDWASRPLRIGFGHF